MGPCFRRDDVNGLLRRFASPQGVVIVRLDRTIQYAAASRFILRRLWNTGSPAFAGDDDQACLRIPAARSARAMHDTFASRKTEGAGKAGCPLHPQPRVRNLSEAHERSHHRSTGFTRPSLRNGFNGLFRALPGERIRLVTVVRGLRFCRTRSGPACLRELDTSNGCQDHTALPSAKAPIVSRAS